MLDTLLFLAKTAAGDICTGGISEADGLAKMVIKVLQIAVPIGLIVMGTIDMAKAVIAGDEKKMKEAQKPFIKRIVSAVIVFLIPYIVSVVVGLVTSNGDYKGCWDAAEKAQSFDVMSTK